MTDDMNRLELVNEALREALTELIGRMEWIEVNKPDSWYSISLKRWIVYGKQGGQFEAPTLAEAIDMAMEDMEGTE